VARPGRVGARQCGAMLRCIIPGAAARRMCQMGKASAMISTRCDCTARRPANPGYRFARDAPESCKRIGRLAFIMLTFRSIRPAWLFVAVGALTACAADRPTAPQAGTAAAHAQLESARTMFASGRYGDVIRMVATSDQLAAAPTEVRVEALKLQAFSYCVSKYRRLCEDGFVRILHVDPSFDLQPAERGHPLWGPAFRSAKSAMTPAQGVAPAARGAP